MRLFVCTFENVTVTAVQDLFQIIPAAHSGVRIHRVEWAISDDASIPPSQMIRSRCSRLEATITNGSAGTTVVPAAFSLGLTGNQNFTCLANNTTKATSTGSITTIDVSADHGYNGFKRTFEEPIIIRDNEGFVFELLSVVQATTKMSGRIVVEEVS